MVLSVLQERRSVTIKACIIGVSGYGEVHYNLMVASQAEGKVEIVGAAIINQDEEAEKCAILKELGCRIFNDDRTMLGELRGVADFCMIPTGTPLHRPMTVRALEAGMHVLVEKPAAGCVEDVRAMQRAAEKANRIVAVGYQQMYTSATSATKQLLLNGKIGKLISLKCLALSPRNHAYYQRNNWAGKLTVDGLPVNDYPFNNAFAHDLMMMLFMAGSTELGTAMPVAVEAELYRANAIESVDTACMRIETSEGVPILFYGTHACRDRSGPEIYIRGTEGSIVITHEGNCVSPAGGQPVSFAKGGNHKARQIMMASVLDALQGGASFVCDLDMASRQTMVVDAIREQCAITPVKGEILRTENEPATTVIPGIEETLCQAFEKEEMPCGITPG